LITELRRESNIKEAVKGQGSVTYGISLMQDYDLIIDPNSTNLIKELNNYSWLEKKSNTPIDDHNHLIDAARYAISYQLKNPNYGSYAVR
jgi:phage terminase large subunit